MKQEALTKIRELRSFAEGMARFWAAYEKTISDPSCDKHEARFNGDTRFKLFETSINFCALTGYYGNSGCSTFGSFNSALAKTYLPKAMQALKCELFQKMAEFARDDAATLTEEAQKEADALQAMINEVRALKVPESSGNGEVK